MSSLIWSSAIALVEPEVVPAGAADVRHHPRVLGVALEPLSAASRVVPPFTPTLVAAEEGEDLVVHLHHREPRGPTGCPPRTRLSQAVPEHLLRRHPWDQGTTAEGP